MTGVRSLRYFSRTRSYQEIAATLSVPVGTIRSRLNQAKAKLADALLETAAAAHIDHVKLVQQRTHEWEAAVDEIVTTGSAERYAAACSPDVLVVAPTLAYARAASLITRATSRITPPRESASASPASWPVVV